jgi:hypothetical protein
VFGAISAYAFRCFWKKKLAKKNQSDDFLIIYNGFDMLMSKIKKSKKTILIYFQAKSYFETHHAPQCQIHTLILKHNT